MIPTGGKIAVTPRSLSSGGHPALRVLEEAGYRLCYPTPGRVPTTKELQETLRDCIGYLAGTESITEEVLESAPGLRVISRNGVGVDAIDLDAAHRRGVEVLTAPAANSQGVAELAIALMLSALRDIPWHDAQIKAGQWERRQGKETLGKTLGLVGCGQIGRRVARIALAMGMEVTAFDAFPSPEFGPPGFRWETLEGVLASSDVLSLHLPPADSPLLDAAALLLLKQGCIVINTARASLVDESAMLRALDCGQVGGFATDVFRTEPPESSLLLTHPKVITTPHIGGYTEESVSRATSAAVENLLRGLSGTS